MLLPYIAIALLVVATLYSAIVSFRESPADARPSWLFPQSAMRGVRTAVAVASFAIVLGFALKMGIGAGHSIRPSSHFLIPEGYTGWVRVEFEVPGASALPMEDGRYMLRIPVDGKLTTSSPEQYGWANDEYYFYSSSGIHRLADSGSEGLIWGKLNGEAVGSSGTRKYEEFFVGTRQQFEQQVNRPPDVGH